MSGFATGGVLPPRANFTDRIPYLLDAGCYLGPGLTNAEAVDLLKRINAPLLWEGDQA